MANLFTDFDKTLAYLRVDFPLSLAVLIRTTNRLERFHKEMRRKQRDNEKPGDEDAPDQGEQLAVRINAEHEGRPCPARAGSMV